MLSRCHRCAVSGRWCLPSPSTKALGRFRTSEPFHKDRQKKRIGGDASNDNPKDLWKEHLSAEDPCFSTETLTKQPSLTGILGISVFYPRFPCGTWMRQLSGSRNIQWRRIYSREPNNGPALQTRLTALSKYLLFSQEVNEETWLNLHLTYVFP